MKTFLSVLVLLLTWVACVVFAAEPPPLKVPPAPKLTADQITQVNAMAQASRVADLEKQIAELKSALARSEQEKIVLKACWAQGVAEKDCEPQPDGTLTKPPKPAPK